MIWIRNEVLQMLFVVSMYRNKTIVFFFGFALSCFIYNCYNTLFVLFLTVGCLCVWVFFFFKI